MSPFVREIHLPRSLPDVFEFFLTPAHLLAVSPPELHMQLEAAPERLKLGACVTLKGRRWGIPHRIVSEVTAYEENVMFKDEQRQGPFGKWVHTHRFAVAAEGTLVRDEIDFEPPSGLLGLVVTVKQIEKDLEWIFAYREKKLLELLGAAPARGRELD